MNGTLKLQRKRRWTALNDCKENDVEGHLMTAKRTVVNAAGDCEENGVERHFITAKNKGFKRYLLIAKTALNGWKRKLHSKMGLITARKRR